MIMLDFIYDELCDRWGGWIGWYFCCIFVMVVFVAVTGLDVLVIT